MEPKILVIVPARGGSKGVRRKNVKLLGGRPLISFTLNEARKIFPDDVICVTTDDDEVIKVVEESGLQIPFKRPASISRDTSSAYEFLIHALEYYSKRKNYNADILILLQPTSPFRKASQILEALKLYQLNNVDMVVSAKRAKANPYFNLFEEDSHGWLRKSKEHNFTRRQDTPDIWEINGAIYIMSVDSLMKQKCFPYDRALKYEMNEFDSHDIDTPFDWSVAEQLVKELI